MITLAGFLTSPESDLPILLSDSGVRMLSFVEGFTVAGTVPDSNRIPFYTNNGMLPYHQSGDKDRNLFKIRWILCSLN